MAKRRKNLGKDKRNRRRKNSGPQRGQRIAGGAELLATQK